MRSMPAGRHTLHPGSAVRRASLVLTVPRSSPIVQADGTTVEDGTMAKSIAVVHHADRRQDVMMPYAPALLVRRGRLLFVSGVTAAPVYHSHPHREEEFDLPDN